MPSKMGSFLYPNTLTKVAMHVSAMVISVPSHPLSELQLVVLAEPALI